MGPVVAAISVGRRGGGEIGPAPSEAAAWSLLYFAIVVLALAAMLLPPTPPGRGFLVELGVGLGFLSLAMLSLQFALTARFRRIASPFGLDTLLHFHRQAGLVAFGLALAHPILLVTVDRRFLAFLDPRVDVARAGALWFLLLSLVLVIGTTLGRRRLGLSYELWRTGHAVLATMIVFIGIVHVMRVGHYAGTPWQRGLWIAIAGGALLLLVYARVVKPWLVARRPYCVREVRAETPTTYTLVLAPVGHPGLTFRAGQFGWLTLGASPFSLEQHPFSFSSSAVRRDAVEITIKELGDYTRAARFVEPGAKAYIEGPYGAFTLDPHARSLVVIAGGVGITPVMSILRTMSEQDDGRPVLLIYANQDAGDVLFLAELADLATRLDLRIVPVLERGDLEGGFERGRVDDALLARHVPPDDPGTQYLVCGPEPMMDVAERYLLSRGVTLRRLSSERFDIA